MHSENTTFFLVIVGRVACRRERVTRGWKKKKLPFKNDLHSIYNFYHILDTFTSPGFMMPDVAYRKVGRIKTCFVPAWRDTQEAEDREGSQLGVS